MKHLKTAFITILLILFTLSPAFSQEKASPLISSFNAGELSPKLDNRSDLDKYFAGARTLENFVPLIEGGATRMPGTYFVLETKDSTQQSRLIPFQFSTIQSYIIEAGNEYFRFYKEDGQITSVDTYTTLLLHADGADESTTFTDSGYTIHTITDIADAEIDTAQYKFGTASGFFDGVDDRLTAPDHNDWNFGAYTTPFTIDAWIRFYALPTAGTEMTIVARYDSGSDYWKFIVENVGGTYYLSFKALPMGADWQGEWTTPVIDTWYHVAVMRNGWEVSGEQNDGYAVTLDGVALTEARYQGTVPDPGTSVLGVAHLPTVGNYFNGWIEELRVSNGACRWTTTFTPPTQQYPFEDVYYLTGGGFVVYEVATPYAATDLFELKFTQSADVLYITHPDYPPKTLTRSSHISWTFTDFVSSLGDEMEITGISKASTAVVTCTTVPTTLAEGDIVYIADVSGMTEVNNLFFTAGTVVTGGAGTFELFGIGSGAYTTYTSGGTAQETQFGIDDNNPSCVTFFEQRLVMASTNDDPQTFWLSASAGYTDFTQDANDDSAAIQYTIASNRVDRIHWMVGQDYLFLGTVGGNWKVGATSTDEPITASNITAKKQGTKGVKNIAPEAVADAILWVTRAGTAVRQISYYYLTDKYESLDLTRIASHIAMGSTRALSGIEQLAFQREPLPILWAIRADGVLLGMTYEIQEKVYSWFRIVTDGEFESVAVVSEEDEEDEIWVIVKRTLASGDVRYIEYFKPYEFFADIGDAFFVHSGLTWDGTGGGGFQGSTDTLNNLDHLEGETLAILGDGLVQTSKTVSGGSITLETAASTIHVGLPYSSILEPMKVNPTIKSGTVRGKKQRINKILVNFYETGDGVEFGPSQSDLKDFTGFTAGSLTTDALDEAFHGNWDDEATISIVQSDPLPVTVLGIVPWMTISGQ